MFSRRFRLGGRHVLGFVLFLQKQPKMRLHKERCYDLIDVMIKFIIFVELDMHYVHELQYVYA